VGRPKAEALGVSNRIELVDFGCSTTKDIVYVGRSDMAELAEGIETGAEGFVRIGTDESDKPINNAEKVPNETHWDIALATREEAGSPVVTVLLGFEGQNDTANGIFIS
jgi:hypothetical protein